MRKRKKLMAAVALLLAGYVLSYLWLSRQGYAEADRYNIKGFFYFSPENTATWQFKNYSCAFLFWPLNVVDRSLGIGRNPGSEPLWELSR